MICLDIPGSKSWINRFLILACLSEGESICRNFNACDDTLKMVEALRMLGHDLIVEGDQVFVTPRKWRSAKVNAGEAGSVARFLTPIAAWLGHSEISLDSSLARRPFEGGLNAVREAGGEVVLESGCLRFGRPMTTKKFSVGVETTTQFLSGFEMLAASMGGKVMAVGSSESSYPQLTRDLIKKFKGSFKEGHQEVSFSGEKLEGQNLSAEIDLSGATSLLVALILSEKEGMIRSWPQETWQAEKKIPEVLRNSGLDLEILDEGLFVKGGEIKNLDCDVLEFPDVIPYLVVLALRGSSASVFRNAYYLKAKESDRLQALIEFGNQTKTRIYESQGDLIVEPGAPESCTLNSQNDHRMAMTAYLFKTLNQSIDVLGDVCLNKSFPRFVDEWGKVARGL